MTDTQLSELIQQHVHASIQAVFARKADTMAEKMAENILRDAERRARFEKLVDQAFDRALQALSEPRNDGE